MIRAGDVYYRVRERKERGIPARCDDHANMWGTKQLYCLLGWVQIHVVIDGRIVRKPSRGRKCLTDATLDRRCRFMKSSAGLPRAPEEKGSCRQGESFGGGCGATPFGGTNIASGTCSGSRQQFSPAICIASAVAIALS